MIRIAEDPACFPYPGSDGGRCRPRLARADGEITEKSEALATSPEPLCYRNSTYLRGERGGRGGRSERSEGSGRGSRWPP
jgi:hypothetical protein